jgi:excisionase family DNA binding protein
MTETLPPSPEPIGRFLTLADTAEILNITARQALALIHSGELPAIQVRGRAPWRIERTVLESYIEAKYEESRRMALWNQSAFTELPELSGGRIIRR